MVSPSSDLNRNTLPDFHLKPIGSEVTGTVSSDPLLVQVFRLVPHPRDRRTFLSLGMSAAAALALAGGPACSPSVASGQQTRPGNQSTDRGQPPSDSQADNHCPPGETPRFRLGFATLKEQLGAPMGDPVTCEYPDPSGTGDTLQRTTTGLAYYRQSTQTPSFTDGNERWALTTRGLIHWVGPIDAPTPTSEPTSTPPPPSRIGGTRSTSGTQPCGAPIPPGAICTCNCVPAR